MSDQATDHDVVGAIRLALQMRSLTSPETLLETIESLTRLAPPTEPQATRPTHLLVDTISAMPRPAREARPAAPSGREAARY